MLQSTKCVAVKIPLHIHKEIEYPEPTFYREITALIDGKVQPAYIESLYWFEHNIYSQKQLQWLGDVKVKIQRQITSVEFIEYSKETSYLTASGKTFNLKSFSKVWGKIKARKVKKSSIVVDKDIAIKLPTLIPISLDGKIEYRMYQVLCRYATRLHYEKLLQFEYLYRSSKIYNKNSEKKVLPKKLLQLTHKAFDYISQEIKNNPNSFKQKLNPRELRRHRIKHGATVLQKSNKKKRDANIIKVKEAIATGKYYKANGTTLNATAIATATALNVKTVRKIINSF